MKNICLLIYDLRSGGAEKVLSQWSVLLSKEHKVYMTIYDPDTEIAYPYGGELVCLKGKANNKNILTKSRVVLQRARALEAFVKEKNIDVVISFCNECNLVNTISNHRAKKICSIRSASDLDSNKLVNFVVRAKNNKIIVQTEALKRTMLERYGNKISSKLIVFGNPFQVEVIREKAKEQPPEQIAELLKNKKAIVNVASFKPQKNHANMLKTFELVAKEVNDVFLLFVGADSTGLRAKLEEMSRKSQFADRIIFVGELRNPFSVVSRSSIFVLPSLAEGIPNVLAEAMICGTPVIACNCPTGPAELICANPEEIYFDEKGRFEGDYGLLIEPFKSQSDYNYDYYDEQNRYLAKAIVDVLEDDDYRARLSVKANLGAERFDIADYTKQLLNIIDGIA